MTMQLPLLPTINASLNALAGILLVCGYFAIKRKDQITHRKFMMAAFYCSGLFLCSYVYYHATNHVLTRYQGTGFLRALYFLILIPHTILAVIIVPFIIRSIWLARHNELAKHVRITRWLYPAWVYVSVTGVLVYLMLYVFPQG